MHKILFCISLIIGHISFAQKVLPLYATDIPNSKPSIDKESVKVLEKGITIIDKISRPTLTVFLPPKNKATGTAVIICPGGGYWVVAAGHEGVDIAKKFNKMGVAAFVLKYRIPNDEWMLNRSIGPLQDAQQAIKTVRDSAEQWGINPAKIGIMGFSAGGHLAVTAGTHYQESLIPNLSQTNLRPDFMVLVYPVISLLPPIAHTGSAEQLWGKGATEDQLKFYSGEMQVTPSTPPSFLVHASDDDAVSALNSLAFYQSLQQNKVPAELHIYQSGGHGFGMHRKNTDEKWMDRCMNWMKINQWLKP